MASGVPSSVINCLHYISRAAKTVFHTLRVVASDDRRDLIVSADEPVEDKAKARAEERAERELQLKIDTLELEREKFRHTQGLAFFDRVSAAAMRGATALLFASGSTILACLTTYRSLVEVVTKPVLHRSLVFLAISFLVATGAFVAALIMSAQVPDTKDEQGVTLFVYGIIFGILAMAAFGLFGWALGEPIHVIKQSWSPAAFS